MFSPGIFNNVVYFGSIIMLAVGALLPIVDPFGGAPIVMVMTADLTPAQRKRMVATE
jgi:small neutral amino acid transporter SnatA (MarC family)